MKPAEGGVLLLRCPRTAVRLVDAVRGLRRMVMAITMPVMGFPGASTRFIRSTGGICVWCE